MTRLKFPLLVLLVTLSSTSVAHAFSTQSATDTLKGNASSFADPDEQQPAFVTAPGDVSSQTRPNQPSISPDQNAARERYLGLSQGFDGAYSRK